MEPGIGAISSMTPIFLYLVLALVAASALTLLALRRRHAPIGIEQARALMDSLDMEAFRNLVDPQEEAFLQSSLPARQFRIIQRERNWTALCYVKSLGHVALEFSHFGHAVRQSTDPRLAELGRQIEAGAIQLRLLALQAGARLFVAATFPHLAQRCPRSLFDQYERSTRLVIRCGILERSQKQAA
jgi:hypothetical protein